MNRRLIRVKLAVHLLCVLRPDIELEEWERAVEEAVAPVIKRLANKVSTAGLSKLTAIALEDCKTMRAAFSRCSQLLHSASEFLNPRLPAPNVIQSEIETLRNWVTGIRERQDKIDEI